MPPAPPPPTIELGEDATTLSVLHNVRYILSIKQIARRLRSRRRHLQAASPSSSNASSSSATIWDAMAPGDLLMFVVHEGNCTGAASLTPCSSGQTGPCYGGVLDVSMEASIQLIIPPSAYYLCYAPGPFDPANAGGS